jgi:ABC-type transport system involved in multi-copper enzyme maturation permease subunit
MTFLPIVERELGIAARRKSTYRVRTFGTLAMLVIVGFYLLVVSRSGSLGANAGSILFKILAWISFIFVCFTGLLTSDAISQERREGTLGLLFLTDLRGHDVVLGKLMSNSLQMFYSLLAVFPVLGLPLLMGGVTGGEFWRTLIVLVNTLFFSVALGIFISSISHDSQKALHATFLFVIVSVLGLPLLDGWINWSNAHAPVLSLISPGFTFLEIAKNSYGHFWPSILLTNAGAWCFLGLAIYFTPRLWQQKSSDAKSEVRHYNQRFGSPAQREKLRQQTMEKNPVYWIALRRRWSGMFMKIVVLIAVALFAWSLLSVEPGFLRYFSHGVRMFVTLALEIWVAGQAARFFVEGWSNGALELLLCSPLHPRQIVQGQWLALKRIFFLPTALLAAVQLIGGILEIGNYSQMGQNAREGWMTFRAVMIAGGFINFFVGLAAIAWVGMWMGLTTKKQNVAVIKTFVFVEIIPWFAFAFLQPFLYFIFRPTGTAFPMANVLITFALSFSKNIAFILWSRKKLYAELREIVSAGGKISKSLDPLLPIDKPPVIANPA